MQLKTVDLMNIEGTTVVTISSGMNVDSFVRGYQVVVFSKTFFVLVHKERL